jgi:hypothetical protein
MLQLYRHIISHNTPILHLTSNFVNTFLRVIATAGAKDAGLIQDFGAQLFADTNDNAAAISCQEPLLITGKSAEEDENDASVLLGPIVTLKMVRNGKVCQGLLSHIVAGAPSARRRTGKCAQ